MKHRETHSPVSTPVVEGDSVGLSLSADGSSDDDGHSREDRLGEEHVDLEAEECSRSVS